MRLNCEICECHVTCAATYIPTGVLCENCESMFCRECGATVENDGDDLCETCNADFEAREDARYRCRDCGEPLASAGLLRCEECNTTCADRLATKNVWWLTKRERDDMREAGR